MSLLKLINNAVRPSSNVDSILENIISAIPLEEMRHSRGKEFTKTGYYQIRVKPLDKNITRDEVLYKLENKLRELTEQLTLKEIQVNQLSRNSSKFGSVSFVKDDIDYDIVVARGGNGGELFERELIRKMNKVVNNGVSFENDLINSIDKHVSRINSDSQAKAALKALRDCDPAFRLNNITSIEPRSGSTRREKLSSDEIGKTIADIVIVLKNNTKKYISVKSSRGNTISQFGVSKAFNDDLTVNVESSAWQKWLAPFGLDPKKVSEGLIASRDDTELQWPDVDHHKIKVKPGQPIYAIMEQLWGTGYYYLRETKNGFKAFKIDRDFVDTTLLKNLIVSEIRYPSKDRKQISIYLQSDVAKYKIEVRNPRGRGSSRPTQIQLTLLGGPL